MVDRLLKSTEKMTDPITKIKSRLLELVMTGLRALVNFMMSRIPTLLLSLANLYLGTELRPLVLVMMRLRVLVDISEFVNDVDSGVKMGGKLVVLCGSISIKCLRMS